MSFDVAQLYRRINRQYVSGQRNARLPVAIGNIPASPELGVVASYEVRVFQVEGRIRQAVAGHEGATARIDAALRLPVPGMLASGRPTIISIGPQATWGDRKYARRFFGIDAGRAARTGLRRYEPADAWTYGNSVAVIRPLFSKLTLIAVGSASRLTGDTARSPIARERPNFTGVLALSWRFES